MLIKQPHRKKLWTPSIAPYYKAAGGGGGGFSLDWAGNLEDASGGTTVTYTSVPIGSANASRVVGVGIWWRASSDSDTITSMTVGGISATQTSGTYSTRSDSGADLSDIWYASVPTGTAATIVINYSASSSRSGVSTYRIITSTPTPSSAGFGIFGGGPPSTTATSGSITVPGGGAGFAIYGARNQSSATTWTNATGDYSANIGTNLAGVSSAKFTVSNVITGSGDGFSGSAISAATWS